MAACCQFPSTNALFALIGTTYGGDGQTTFALPDLRGRLPVHQGQGPGLSNYVLGQMGGSETVTLTSQQLPAHTHAAQGQSAAGNQAGPGGGVWAASAQNQFSANAPIAGMSTAAIGADRRQPAARQHDALPGRQFYHLPLTASFRRGTSVTVASGGNHDRAIYR